MSTQLFAELDLKNTNTSILKKQFNTSLTNIGKKPVYEAENRKDCLILQLIKTYDI